MKKIILIISHFLIVFILTVISQVGGFIYLTFLLLNRYLKLSFSLGALFFIILYLLGSFVFVPIIATHFGREPLPISGSLRPLNIMTCVLNRHYVNSDLLEEAMEISIKMNQHFPGTKINYLDANFPFWDGFPLFPHLSHDDGRKLDLAFLYFEDGQRSDGAPSPIGYGIYVKPEEGEVNYPKSCQGKGFWQYGAISYLVPKWKEKNFTVDSERTKYLIEILSAQPQTSKIFIEPHLKERWKLSSPKIRFHGCHAVRHDDHIHWQVK